MPITHETSTEPIDELTPPFTPGNRLISRPKTPKIHHEALPPVPVHSADVSGLDDRVSSAGSENGSIKIRRFNDFLDDELFQLKQRLVTEFGTQVNDWREFMINSEKRSRIDKQSAQVSPFTEVIQVDSVLNSRDEGQDGLDVSTASRCTVGSTREITLDSSLSLPVARWRKFFLEVMRPTARASRSYKHYVNESWVHYLGMLRYNKRNSVSTLDSAREKITISQRRNVQRILTSNASLRSVFSGFAAHSIIHPHSGKRHIWVWWSLCLLLCDSIAVPIVAFFGIDHSSHLGFVLWFTLCFWLIDILVTFRTGRELEGSVEMRPAKIAKLYAKSWLVFDAGLVLLDLVLSILALLDLLVGKGVRILLLSRLLRLMKVQNIFEELLSINVTRKRVIRYSNLLKFMLLCTIYFHTLACTWYGIGQLDDIGWVSTCSTQSSSRVYCYLTAAHWAFAWFCGTVEATYNTSIELAVATVASYIGVVCFAMFLGMMINTMSWGRNSTGLDTIEMRIRCAAYTKNHNLSKGLSRRLLKYILSCDIQQEDLSQRLRQESEMLQNLPLSLQTEILQEARLPHLATIPIIRDLDYVSPIMATRLCSEIVSSVISLCGDFVFTAGDTGTHWRVVENGSLIYALKTDDPQQWSERNDVAGITTSRPLVCPTQTVRSSAHKKGLSWDSFLNYSKTIHANTASEGTSISEMVLWTSWVHTGDLLASTDCVLLWLSLDAFIHLIKARTDACLLAATYAHAYVRRLNETKGLVSDLYTYSGSPEDFEPDLLGIVGSRSEEQVSHYRVFLSHYKAEAGTEATLMQESLQRLIAREMATNTDNPFKEHEETPYVFLDSEDLTDLSTLKEMVCKSDNLVLLLTPGVLLRPWCLVEIVTALTNGVCIVPVEIQRPGLKFKYPDNEFYARLRRPKSLGGLLLGEDLAMLEDEGISIDSVEDAIRFVCTHIALPFSPHKSKTIREAELADIVKRCIPSYRSGASKSTKSQAASFVLEPHEFKSQSHTSTKPSHSSSAKSKLGGVS